VDTDKLITNELPFLGDDLIPLWRDRSNTRFVQAKGWPTKDFSHLDWNGKYTDIGKDKKNFTRQAPIAYGVRGGMCVIIDIDAKGDPEKADIILEQLKMEGLDVNTYTVKTKSHGYHLYYRSPMYSVKTMTAWRDSVDIRGKGGFVVGPDVTLDHWEEGTYMVVNHAVPIDCTLDLPKYGEKTLSLPKIDTGEDNSVISITDLLEQRERGERIAAGQRDAALLRISGWCVSKGLTDDEISVEFNNFNFENVAGDEITLENLMDKVERDREKNSSAMGVALSRFVFIMSSQNFFDVVEHCTITSERKLVNYHPIKVPGLTAAGHTTQHYVMDKWREHPDRLVAHDFGYKPNDEKIYIDSGKGYVNQYVPSPVTPWDEEVSWDDPYLSEYRMLVENLCNYDERTIEILMSARAAKIQDLLWTPRWGFVMVSEEKRMGKDFQTDIFRRLIAANYTGKSVVAMSDLLDGRNSYLEKSIMVVVNEPKGMGRDNVASEGIKLLFSETTVATKAMYQGRSAEKRVYRIPEIHSNEASVVDLARSNKRFAPIICKQLALDTEVYTRLDKKCNGDGDDKDCKLLRMLMRLFLDWKIHKDVTETAAPVMTDGLVAEQESKDPMLIDMIQHIEDHSTLMISDLQTKQSMMLAISQLTSIPKGRPVNRLWKTMVKEGTAREVGRARAVPTVKYHSDTYEAHELDKMELTETSSKSMVTVYSIRNHDRYPGEEKITECVRNHFFNIARMKQG